MIMQKFKFLFLIAVIWLTGCSPATVATQASTPADSSVPVDPAIELGVNQAVAAFNESNFDGALERLQGLYAEFCHIAPPRIVMAQWFAESNFSDESVRVSLEMATDETPDDPEAYLLLADIALRQGHLTAAELLLQAAKVKLDAYVVNKERKDLMQTAWLRTTISLAETRGRWNVMLDMLEVAGEQNGGTPTLLRQKGVALFQLKREAEALTMFAKADSLAGTLPDPDTGLPAEAAMAQLYQLRGDWDNAQKYLAEALKKFPRSREVVMLSIQSRMNEDQLEEACTLAENLLVENPTWQPAKRLLASIALYLSDYAGAEKLFQELILDSPSDEQVMNGLALAQSEQNDPQKLQRALEYARENVRRNQHASDHWATLGWVLYKANQFEAADQAIRRATAIGRVNAATAYYQARLALQAGQTADAIRLLEAAIDTSVPFAKRRDATKLLEVLKK